MRSPRPEAGRPFPLPAQRSERAGVRRPDLPAELMSHAFRTSRCNTRRIPGLVAGLLPNVTAPLQGRNMTVTPASQRLFVPLRARPEAAQFERVACVRGLGCGARRASHPRASPPLLGRGGGRTGPTAGETGPPLRQRCGVTASNPVTIACTHREAHQNSSADGRPMQGIVTSAGPIPRHSPLDGRFSSDN